MEKTELVITALQQRIGELVSNYETQIAVLRAEITHMLNQQEEKEKAAQAYSQQLSDMIGLENTDVVQKM